MRNFIFLICVILPIFFMNNMGIVLGIEQVLTVTMSPLILYCLYSLFNRGIKINSIVKSIYTLLFISLFVFILKISIDQYDFVRDLVFMGIIPSIIILAFERLTFKQHKLLQFVLIIFFLFNGILFFAEWVTKQNFFYIENDFYGMRDGFENWEFRSQGPFNHPIYASMIISLMMVMIMFSKLKLSIKLILYAVGLFSLLFINTRTGIAISFGLFLPALYYNIKNVDRTAKKWFAFVGILLLFGIIYTVFNTDLGGRLIGYGDDDGGSAQQRLVSLNFLEFVSDDLFLYGSNDFQAGLFTTIGWIENGYIAFILKYGIIGGIPLLLSLMAVHFYQLKRFSVIGRICIFCSFYVFALTNPHIANPNIWVYFLFIYYGFVPRIRLNRNYLFRRNLTTTYHTIL